MRRNFALMLRSRIALIIGAYVALLLLCVLVVVGLRMNDSVAESAKSSVLSTATARAAQISDLVDKMHWQLRILALRPEFLSQDRKATVAAIATLKSSVSLEVASIVFAWPDGSFVSSSGANGNIADKEYFQKIASGSVSFVVGKPDLQAPSGGYEITFANAVKASGSIVGMIGFKVRLSDLSTLVAKVRIGKGGYGWIVDSDGDFIAHPIPAKVMTMKLGEADKTGYKGFDAMKVPMAKGKPGSWVWKSTGGRSIITFFAPIEADPDWTFAIDAPLDEITSSVRPIVATLIVILIVSTLVSAILAVIVAGSIARPIALAGASFRELTAGEADLRKRIEMRRGDEIGGLARDFNAFLDKLREIVTSLKEAQTSLGSIGDGLGDSVAATSSAVSRISEAISDVQGKTDRQGQSVGQASSAVEQIAHNIEGLEALIENQAASVAEASAAIEEMVGNIASVSRSMETMAEQFEVLLRAANEGKATQDATFEKIKQISERSDALLEANEVIAGIASQTNLLAMNAAIEAAHAGEAGKGFSVVSDEIRRLAETAAEQARTISISLSSVQSDIADIVESARASGAAFDDVAEGVIETERHVREMRNALGEQREGGSQVLEALKSVNDITSEVSSGSNEMNAGNKIVLGEMDRLREVSGEIASSMEALRKAAMSISESSDRVASMAETTRATISGMEHSIGRFIV